MDSDQSSDADKTGKMLDPSDNNQERSTISIDPDNNEEIGDLSTCVQDVPVSTGESDKGVEDPGTSKNMALCADILKDFFSSNLDKFQVNESSIPGQSDQHEEKSKRDVPISFPLGSDHEKLKSEPGEVTSFPRKTSFLDAWLDKIDSKKQQPKPIEGLPDIFKKKSVDSDETSDHGQTNVSPLDVKRTVDSMHRSDDSNARSPTKRKHEQGVSDSNQSDSHILGSDHKNLKYYPAEGTSFQRKPHKPTHSQEKSKPGECPTNVSPMNVVGTDDSMQRSRNRKHVQGVSDSVSCTDSETTMSNLKSMKEREVAMKAEFKIETGCLQRKRAVPENVACESKPSKISIPKPLGVIVSDPEYPTPNYDKYRQLSLLGERAPLDVFKRAVEEFNWLTQVRRRQRLLLQENNMQRELQQLGVPVNEVERASTANVSEGAVSEAVETSKEIPDNIALVKPTGQEKPNVPYPFDIKDPPAPQENPDLSKYCEFQEAEKYPVSPGSSDGSGGEVDDRDESEAASGTVVTAKEKIDNTVTSEFLKPSVQEKPNVTDANPFDCTDPPVPHEVKVDAMEVGGVKRHRSDTVQESPKKRKLPEGAVSPDTEAGISLPSLSPDVLSLQKKPTAEPEIEVGHMEVGGIKRQWSVIVEPPKKRQLSEDTVSPEVIHCKDQIP